MASERIDVSPEVLTWARTSLNLEPLVAAKKLGVKPATLQRWESGELMPTIVQLRKASRVYGRPLAVLLLEEPPTDFSVPRDFRRHPSSPSPELVTEIRRAHEQSDVIREIAEHRPDLVPELPMLPSAATSDDPELVGQQLRSLLAVPLAAQQSWSQPNEALNGWISAVEDAGILVMQTGGVDIGETLGFSLHADKYPVIALNGSDWTNRRIFTLMHELGHLALGRGAICDLHDGLSPSEDVEAFCNRVAAAILLPSDAVRQAIRRMRLPSGTRWSTSDVEQLANTFRVSRESALIRLISLQAASWVDYNRLKPVLDEELAETIADQRERLKSASGGPSYYVIKTRNLGQSYTHTVLNAYHSDAISPLDAATFLQVRFQQLRKLEAAA